MVNPSGQNFHQGRFPSPISSRQSNPVARIHLKIQSFEQYGSTEIDRQILNANYAAKVEKGRLNADSFPIELTMLGGSRAFRASPRLPGGLPAGCGGSSRRLLAARQLPPVALRACLVNPCRGPTKAINFQNK
jgi:hypothetical protein